MLQLPPRGNYWIVTAIISSIAYDANLITNAYEIVSVQLVGDEDEKDAGRRAYKRSNCLKTCICFLFQFCNKTNCCFG